MGGGIRRRDLLRQSLAVGGAAAIGPALMRLGPLAERASGAPPRITNGPYGPLQPSGADGVQVPAGFEVREIARGNVPLGTTGYVWPPFPDGSGSFPQPDGGWIFACNCEVPEPGESQGGASAIRFDRDGNARSAYRILSGTRSNCGGGITPWGTWLSGEEVDTGLVWECDLTGQKPAEPRPAMGVFSHEYAVVHEAEKRVYLTEDESGGGFYRFTPAKWGDLRSGLLEIAELRSDGIVVWHPVPDPEAKTTPTRQQVAAASKLKRPEGLCVHARTGMVHMVESSASRVFTYEPATQTYTKVYNEADYQAPILTDTDNIAASPISRDLFVCEDSGDLDICMITPEGEVAKFVHLDGPQHGDPSTDASSETTGPSFDPSGTRMYFSSQRAYVFGSLYEVTGPWRRDASGGPGPAPSPPPARLKIDAYRRVRRARLVRQGLRVSVVPRGVTADVVVALQVRERGGGRVTLAGARRSAVPPKSSSQRTKLQLRPARKARAYLSHRRGNLSAEIVAVATTTKGDRLEARRSIQIAT